MQRNCAILPIKSTRRPLAARFRHFSSSNFTQNVTLYPGASYIRLLYVQTWVGKTFFFCSSGEKRCVSGFCISRFGGRGGSDRTNIADIAFPKKIRLVLVTRKWLSDWKTNVMASLADGGCFDEDTLDVIIFPFHLISGLFHQPSGRYQIGSYKSVGSQSFSISIFTTSFE